MRTELTCPMWCRPTTSELFPSPRGCLSFADRSSSAEELIAPQETTTMLAEYFSEAPFRRTTTFVTSRPLGLVSNLSTKALVNSLTPGNCNAGSTHITWASDFAWTRHGKPSHVSQRMHLLLCGSFSSSRTPSGT